MKECLETKNSLADVHRLELHPFLLHSVEHAELRGEKCARNHSLSPKTLELTYREKGADQVGRGRIFYAAISESKADFDI